MQLKAATVCPRVSLLLAAVAILALSSACQALGVGANPNAAVTPSVKQPSTPTPEPSPTVAPTETPEPTATPGPIRKDTAVENLVLLTIMTCASQLANATGSNIAPDFDTTFDSVDGIWRIEAFSKTPALTFGAWNVNDETGVITPEDRTAQGISNVDLECFPALARRARGRTPPSLAHRPRPHQLPFPRQRPFPAERWPRRTKPRWPSG